MNQQIRGKDSHLDFRICPKKTNLVEDFDILLPVKFCWLPFSGFRESKMCQPLRGQGSHLGFFDRPEKDRHGTGRWDLATCQVSLKSVQRFQILYNESANQRPGQPFWFSGEHEKHKVDRGRWDLASCQVSLNSVQRFHEKSKMSHPIRSQGGRLVFFSDKPKNINFVENMEILLPVKFRWTPFSGFRGEVEMSQPIRGRGSHLVFPISPKRKT